MTSSPAQQQTLDYINSIVGTPWVQNVTDCYWVIEDSYRKLDGIELPCPPWRQECEVDKAGAEALKTGAWKPCRSQEGAVFAVYNKSGAMCHVGRILAGLAVHSDGTVSRDGQCRSESIKDMERRYRRYGMTVKYYIYEGANG